MMNRRELLATVGAASLVPAAFAVSAPPGHSCLAFQASFRIGPAQSSGKGNARWAEIVAGEVSGKRLSGRVQSGRMEWLVDPSTGAAEVALTCSVLQADGSIIHLRDRSAQASVEERAALPGHPTAPVLGDASGNPGGLPASLVGRLDTTAFWRGFVSLRAFG